MKYRKAIRFLLLLGAVLFTTGIPFLIVAWNKSGINQNELVMFFIYLAFIVGIIGLYHFTEDYSVRVINLIIAILFVYTSLIFVAGTGIMGILTVVSAILYIVAVSLRLAEYEPEAPLPKNSDLLDQNDF